MSEMVKSFTVSSMISASALVMAKWTSEAFNPIVLEKVSLLKAF